MPPIPENSPSRPAPDRRPRRTGVHSMTGYAHVVRETPAGRATVELRSVNSRFADLQFRLADDVREIEPPIREALATAIGRGKVECRAHLRGRAAGACLPQLDESLLRALAQLAQQVRAAAPDAVPLGVADYLRLAVANPDTTGEQAAEAENASAGRPLWTAFEPVFAEALDDLLASRAAEGERLAATIRDQIDRMAQLVAQVAPVVPELLSQAQARLTERLQAAMADVQSPVPAEETFSRIRQEVAMLGLRGDVTEELDRLRIHFSAVRETLATGGAVGKRLDFLTQELNREANTLASKAAGVAVTDAAVDLKLLIEQMREQVQNIE